MEEDLFLEPRIGIIPEVSAQTYGTLAKALREYVANALDAGSKNVWITFSADSQGKTTLDIRDDGSGMSRDQLKKDFLALGGSGKFDDPDRIGRIGIGFLAIVPLAESITIRTKTSKSTQAERADIRPESMMDVAVRMKEIAQHSIGKVNVVSTEDTKRLSKLYGDSFTVFTLSGLRGDVSEEFQDAEKFKLFEEELRKILPLPWPETAPLKKHMSRKLWDSLAKKAARHSINVYLNDSKHALSRRLYGDNAGRETFLYTQEFIEETIVPAGTVEGQVEPVRVTGFFVCDEPVVGHPKETKLSGIIARFQNVAVKDETYFGLEGKEERKKRVSGELFIEGLNKNKAMNLTRNEFSEAYKPVILMNRELADQLTYFFVGINRLWKARGQINKGIKKVESVLEGIGSALESIHKVKGDPLKTKQRKWVRPGLMSHPHKKAFSALVDAVKSTHLTMKVDSDAKPDTDPPYRLDIGKSPQRKLAGSVHVRKDLGDSSLARFNIQGVEYRLQLVSGSLVEPPCALDIKNRFVVLNDSHPLVHAGDRSLMRTLVFIAFSAEVCESAGQMKQMLFQLMMGGDTAGA